MNAYELADELQDLHGLYCENAANMLRQQADRIAELEKELNHMRSFFGCDPAYYGMTPAEPVAWMNKWTSKCVVFINTLPSDDWIPLYTTPQTELNAGGEPVKNATYWKRQYNKAQDRIAELEHLLNLKETSLLAEMDYSRSLWDKLNITPQKNAKPVAWLNNTTTFCEENTGLGGKALIDTTPQTNAEPVAWVINGQLSSEFWRTSNLDVIQPLYTTPQTKDKE